MQSWIKIDQNSDFSIYNIPFGIFSESDHIKRVGIAIGDTVLDVYAAYELGVFKDLEFDIKVLESWHPSHKGDKKCNFDTSLRNILSNFNSTSSIIKSH